MVLPEEITKLVAKFNDEKKKIDTARKGINSTLNIEEKNRLRRIESTALDNLSIIMNQLAEELAPLDPYRLNNPLAFRGGRNKSRKQRSRHNKSRKH